MIPFGDLTLKHKLVENVVILLKRNKVTALAALCVLILIDVLYIPTSSDLRMFTILGVYVIAAKLFKLRSRLTFLLCIGLLGIMYVQFLITGASSKTEKAAVWLVLFWIVGIFQQWKETSKSHESK